MGIHSIQIKPSRSLALWILVSIVSVIVAFTSIYTFLNHQYPSVRGVGSVSAYRNSDRWNASINFPVLERDLKAKYPQLSRISTADDNAFVHMEVKSENGHYYWGSYNYIPLSVSTAKIKVNRLLDPENRIRKNETRLVIFEPVNGEGLIIIVETPPKKLKKQFWCGYPEAHSCDKPTCLKESIYNYIEYKPDGFGAYCLT